MLLLLSKVGQALLGLDHKSWPKIKRGTDPLSLLGMSEAVENKGFSVLLPSLSFTPAGCLSQTWIGNPCFLPSLVSLHVFMAPEDTS